MPRSYCEIYCNSAHESEVEQYIREFVASLMDAKPEWGVDIELPNSDFWTECEDPEEE